MKYKNTIITGALALSLLAGGSAFAATTDATGVTTDNGATTKVETTKKPEMKKLKALRFNSIVGTVQSVDGSNFTIELHHGKKKPGKMITVQTGATTVFMKNKATASFTDVTAGEKVVVTGTMDATTKNVAATKVRVIVRSATKTTTATTTASQ